MQFDPIKPTLKPPGTKRLKLKYDELLSSFAFNFNLRRYTTVPGTATRTANGVTCIGYTDLPSRCAGQASTLFGNNVSNFLLSMGRACRIFQYRHLPPFPTILRPLP